MSDDEIRERLARIEFKLDELLSHSDIEVHAINEDLAQTPVACRIHEFPQLNCPDCR